MTRLARQDGFTLIELLVGAMLMVIVMSATLGVLDNFRGIATRADKRVDLQDSARNTSRQLARSLRNVAASPDLPGVVERAESYDLVFRTVDSPQPSMGANSRNLKRLRYCLNTSTTNARLYEQTQRWTTAAAPAMPPAAACPAPGWTATRLVADRVTNRSKTGRPLWLYGQTASGQITSLKINLFMSEPGAREVSLQTGVFLRNQNRAPTALFSATPVGASHIRLNGSGSTDPEGDALEFLWYVNDVQVGKGLTYDYATPTPGTYVVRLEVRDPSGLSSVSASQSVVIS